MFEIIKINGLLNDCYSAGNHRMSIREKEWAKVMLREGKPIPEIFMFMLLLQNFFTLSEKNGGYLLKGMNEDPPFLTSLGIETLLRVKDNPSIFMEVYKYKCENELYMSINGPYNGFRDDNDEAKWNSKKRAALKSIEKLRNIYKSRIFP